MKIAFIGTGYVGLVSGVMLAHLGHEVVCIDINSEKIQQLKEKKSPIFENDLEKYINLYANSPRLQFIDHYNDEILASVQAVFVTVGTPPRDDGSADLTYLFNAVDELLGKIDPSCYIVIKSTVPPGTCDAIQQRIYKKSYRNLVISNPEFLREGAAIYDFMHPDRIIIGAQDEAGFVFMRDLYSPLKIDDKPAVILESDLKTAELIKYASNSFLANKIAFINEMANLCEKIGADVEKLARGMGSDARIGDSFLKTGPGFGGSCFPKDILALQYTIKAAGAESLLLDAIIDSNNERIAKMAQKIQDILGGSLIGKSIAALGLTYKAGTDDLRSSPALKIVMLLQQMGAIVKAYDPHGMENLKFYPNVQINVADSALKAAQGSDAVVILTEWPEFKQIDLAALKLLVKKPIIIDLRNLLESSEVVNSGFEYHSVGRRTLGAT